MNIIHKTATLIALLCTIIVCALSSSAQIVDPVKWEAKVHMSSATNGTISVIAHITDGWHMYGCNLPDGGPNATEIRFTETKGVRFTGKTSSAPEPSKHFDDMFDMELSWWNDSVIFTQPFILDSDDISAIVTCEVSAQCCNATSCTPPRRQELEIAIGAPKQSNSAIQSSLDHDQVQSDNILLWSPVHWPEGVTDKASQIRDESLWEIFVWGFLGGLVALLTPCVWPMIPLTVSFFLKKGNSRRRSVADALTYGAAIVAIYLTLGLAITLIFGASKLNDLATNAVFNLMFFGLLVLFAISFFGAFDIKLPARWSTAMDSHASSTSGVISIFFMAFTLALVSFSCTGPLIGTLLVEAASNGEILGPAIGMGAFALALAIPFGMFAIFPSLLKELPRSGGWLNSVKVVLGFLELALSLKFLSVADLAYGWGILDREIFLSLWIVIFALLGVYLLGKLRFSHDAPCDTVSVPRFFMALASFSIAVLLLPGLWGAPIKGASAFLPPLYTQDFDLYTNHEYKSFVSYDEGMEYARQNDKPVLIDFSGYGCVNCRKMEGAVFDTPEVKALIRDNYVMITLMVDDKSILPTPIKVIENGKTITLRTVGEKWSYLQRVKFGASTQPYYVILDATTAQPLNKPYYYDENVDRFIDWLSHTK